MFELLPAGFSGGIWSDRHGVIERHPTLGVSGSAFDPGDIAAHGIVAEYDPQISARGLGGAKVQGSGPTKQVGRLRRQVVGLAEG
jgi:hypothetical protein